MRTIFVNCGVKTVRCLQNGISTFRDWNGGGGIHARTPQDRNEHQLTLAR